MRKTIGMLGLGLLVGALAIGPSIASASSLAPSTTLKLTGQATGFQLIEEGKQGFSLGDRIMLGGVLLQGGKQVGHEAGELQRHGAPHPLTDRGELADVAEGASHPDVSGAERSLGRCDQPISAAATCAASARMRSGSTRYWSQCASRSRFRA